MGHQRFFRDPIHGQLRFERVDLRAAPPPADREGRRMSWVLQNLIDSPEFQRLRQIRQNGLTSYVFHGAEHSRFAHSMGVCFLAREMYDAITRNTDAASDWDCRLQTACAGLLHDVGHGPFSHLIEEVLDEADVAFDHELMTTRLILEDTSINKVLKTLDPALPGIIAPYIDKERRDPAKDHWSYRIVSSQLDADRLDYLHRDAAGAGLIGHGFDLPRLLDMLEHLEGTRIAVDRRAIAAVEAYLVLLDQMYRAVYFHKTIRSASHLLSGALRRAYELFKNGDKEIYGDSPVRALFEQGQAIPLNIYVRITESHVWALVDRWRGHTDVVLADLAARILDRRLLKAMDVDATNHRALRELEDRARDIVKQRLNVPDECVDYYVQIDEPSRVSYKRYDWLAERPDESIFMTGGGRKPLPIEEDTGSAIVPALKATRYFHRLILPDFARDEMFSKDTKP